MARLMKDKLMTVHEVAAMFQVTPATVRIWLNDSDPRSLQGIRISKQRAWRVYTSEVNRYANQKYGDIA